MTKMKDDQLTITTVIGDGGFIGSHAADQLSEAGYCMHMVNEICLLLKSDCVSEI